MKNNIGGRPKSPEGSEKTEKIAVRVTPLERAIIKCKADSLNKTISSYMRETALTCQATPAFTPEQAAAARDLEGVANNLNQLAKWANIHHEFAPIKSQHEILLFKIEELLNKF